MKKKRIDLDRKLILDKGTILRLSEQQGLIGGATMSAPQCSPGGCPIDTANCPHTLARITMPCPASVCPGTGTGG